MVVYPHERFPWIAADGSVSPGVHMLDAPLHVPRNYMLAGPRRGKATLRFVNDTGVGLLVEGGVSRLELRGAGRTIHIPNGAQRPVLQDLHVRESTRHAIDINNCVGARLERIIVSGAGGSGVSLSEGVVDCVIHSCAFAGKFTGAAVDMSCGAPSRIQLIHVTVIAARCLDLSGWKPGTRNVMSNCAIYSIHGASPFGSYALHLPRGTVEGTCIRNVAEGTITTAMFEHPVIPEHAIDLTGDLRVDFPRWVDETWPWHLREKLRPGPTRRVLRADLSTSLSWDLEGYRRIPWTGKLAVGAMGRPASLRGLLPFEPAPAPA